MIVTIVIVQTIVFGLFVISERTFPARSLSVVPHWEWWWWTLGAFALVWLQVLWLAWVSAPGVGVELPTSLSGGLIFYLAYSFGNYWFHRIKHRVPWMWRCFHKLHHAPTHMETRIAFFRHPLEMAVNSIYLLILGKLIFNAPIEVVAFAITLEGCLECYHHSNLRTPGWLRPIGYLVQIPEMHLVHHQRGLHRYNYGTMLWDTVFGTVRVPREWHRDLGFANSNRMMDIFRVKNC